MGLISGDLTEKGRSGKDLEKMRYEGILAQGSRVSRWKEQSGKRPAGEDVPGLSEERQGGCTGAAERARLGVMWDSPSQEAPRWDLAGFPAMAEAASSLQRKRGATVGSGRE